MPKAATKKSAGVYTIIIPCYVPPLLNSFTDRHWAVRSRIKKAAKAMIGGYARLADVPPAAGKRRVRLEVTMGPRQRFPDVDSFWKCVLDCLVACKAIRGDAPKWVEIMPVVYKRAERRSTTIILEDI